MKALRSGSHKRVSEMARPKRTGKDRLVTTTVHVPAGALDRIDELKRHQSTFMREAVLEKLEREEGYIAAIEIQSAVVDKLLKQVEDENANLHELHAKHKIWQKKQERKRVKGIVIEEFFAGNHKSAESLLAAIWEDVSTESDKQAIVEEVWTEMRNERK